MKLSCLFICDLIALLFYLLLLKSLFLRLCSLRPWPIYLLLCYRNISRSNVFIGALWSLLCFWLFLLFLHHHLILHYHLLHCSHLLRIHLLLLLLLLELACFSLNVYNRPLCFIWFFILFVLILLLIHVLWRTWSFFIVQVFFFLLHPLLLVREVNLAWYLHSFIILHHFIFIVSFTFTFFEKQLQFFF